MNSQVFLDLKEIAERGRRKPSKLWQYNTYGLLWNNTEYSNTYWHVRNNFDAVKVECYKRGIIVVRWSDLSGDADDKNDFGVKYY